MFAANFILIPVNYSHDAFAGMKALFRVLEEAKEDQDYQFKILRNQLDATKKTMVSMVETYLTHFITDNKVFSTIVRQCEEINKAKKDCEPTAIYAPNSRGATDYHDLTKELLSCLE
jgi:cellulose biosynthesis protein BcsQ